MFEHVLGSGITYRPENNGLVSITRGSENIKSSRRLLLRFGGLRLMIGRRLREIDPRMVAVSPLV